MIKEQDITISNIWHGCCDVNYGDAIVSYQVYGKNFESRCFVENNSISYREQIARFINECGGIDKFPLATDLSEELRMLITESDFDMLFIENDDENYSDEKVKDLFDEAYKYEILQNVIEPGEDYKIAVYAGAICRVNWCNHGKESQNDNDVDSNSTKLLHHEIEHVLAASVGSEYAKRMLSDYDILRAISDDVKLSSAYTEGRYGDDDIRMAVGRVLLKNLNIDI